MNLRFLRTVVAIAQNGSLSAAARELGLSHSAVSLQVKALEDELRFSILDRSRRPPVLTGQGMALVEHARRMDSLASDIRALADAGQLMGQAAIGAVPSTVAHLAAPALARLHGDHPDLRIEFTSALSQRLVDLVSDGAIDCALVTDPGADTPDLASIAICSEPFRLLCAAEEPEQDPEQLLASRPYVWFDRRSRLSQQIDSYFKAHGMRVQSVMEVDSFEGVEALVRHNLGVSILPTRTHPPAQAGIRRLVLPHTDMSRQVALVSRSAGPRRSLVSQMADALKGVLSAK